jgi:glycine oxidase
MFDVLVIGGGLIGLSLARELHKRRAGRIIVAEMGRPGRESSFAAAGMLALQAETDRADAFFEFCSESNRMYRDFARELDEETGIDIEFDDSGTLYLAFTPNDVREIRHRYEWQSRAGLAVERLTASETRKIEPFVSPDVAESLYFPNDCQVENRRLLAALIRYAETNGIEVRTGFEAGELIFDANRVAGARSAAGVEIRAGATVLATGAWTSLIKAEGLRMPPVKPVRGQIIAFQTAKRLFSKVIYSPRGYLVPRADGRLLAGATVEDAGFDASVTEAGIAVLRDRAFEIAPSLAGLPVSDSWAGLRPHAPDGLPVLGGFPGVEGLAVATAHYRNGILLAPLTARIMAELIIDGKRSPHLDRFGPARFAGSRLRVISGN